MPAKAGIQNYLKTLDSRLRGNDIKGRFKTIYESIIIPLFHCSIVLSEPQDLRAGGQHSNRTTLSLDSEALEGRLSTDCEQSELT